MQVGALVSGTASSLTAMVMGRVFCGIGIGLASALVPLYISEVSVAGHHEKLMFGCAHARRACHTDHTACPATGELSALSAIRSRMHDGLVMSACAVCNLHPWQLDNPHVASSAMRYPE